ncbi:MAG: hypothetical protein DRP42_04155 [Tenericutes bacterium]|nr:MAG: hypothetical protein DRP42_04155 [Mycoplasmatota bacterium]
MARLPAENIDEAADRNPDLERSLEKAGVGQEKTAPVVPTYQIISTDSKIPVSSQNGNLWKSRRDQAVNKRKNNLEEEAWEDALCYYDNSQEGARSYADEPARKRHRGTSETENIVFANTSALVPAIYARNPAIEVTVTKEENYEHSIMHEELINVLMRNRSDNGLNMKPKARRAVVATTLMNLSYMEVGYTFKKDSSQAALEDLTKLSEDYATEKNLEKLRLIEGKIAALELKVDLLRPSGPHIKFRRPDQILRDPDSESEDLSDDKWIMIWEYVPTTWLQAMYADDKTGTKSLYKPTHVLNANSVGAEGRNSAEQEIANYTLVDSDDYDNRTRRSLHGYDDDESYKRALRTKIWYVWDKVTRRVYMYNDKDWTWPIWVWDDPYHLDTFFPLAQLTFYTHPIEGVAKSEVVYYLDQQDAINDINSEFKNARQQAKFNVVFDKNRANREDVEKILKGDEGVAVGIDIPEGYSIKDFLQSVVPPSMQYAELFDKSPQFEAIDRLSSVSGVMRGQQFKTNTTNGAIEKYSMNTQTRLDEKIDAVEDFIGDVGWKVLQLCAQFMDIEQVQSLIGTKSAGWQNYSSTEFLATHQYQVVGGSTQKPTSDAKKQQAMELGQVLGQFVNAAPQAVTAVMLKMFERSFSEINIGEEDWQSINEQVNQQGQGGDQVTEMINKLPPEAKQALGKAIAQGVPVEAALEKIMQVAQQQEQQQPGGAGQPQPTIQ